MRKGAQNSATDPAALESVNFRQIQSQPGITRGRKKQVGINSLVQRTQFGALIIGNEPDIEFGVEQVFVAHRVEGDVRFAMLLTMIGWRNSPSNYTNPSLSAADVVN
ncbi:MAG TPA: hypothetical protein VIF64_03990 [Pyrinomonadaceae bacterium]